MRAHAGAALVGSTPEFHPMCAVEIPVAARHEHVGTPPRDCNTRHGENWGVGRGEGHVPLPAAMG